MYVVRAVDGALTEWALEVERRPLVLRGARQTGKTSAVRRLGESFDAFLELNLERLPDRRLVDGAASLDELLLALRLRHNLDRFPRRTLLFLDEIQESTKAVQWLRFLYEDHPELWVVAAGSLLEVRLAERGFSFPVGRVGFRWVHPFTFFDFLEATEGQALRAHLEDAARTLAPVAMPVHEQALAALADYLLVGGMPAAVTAWVRNRSPQDVRQLHVDLLQAFADDMHKYRDVRDPEPLFAAFDALPHHYGLRFKYAGFAPESRSRPMKAALDKLEGAMLVDRGRPTSSFGPPYRRRPRSAEKLIPLDVGMAIASIGRPIEEIHRGDPLQILGGRVAEMFVGQQLRGAQIRGREPLWFWVAESARNNAEVDFLSSTLPIEVKSGKGGTLRSLHRFLWRGGGGVGVRLHAGLLADERCSVGLPGHGELDFRLVSLPLYLAQTLAPVPAWASS